MHDRRFPNEPAEYRPARNALLQAEIELRRQTERVAALRRALPPGGPVPQDYLFQEYDRAIGQARPIRLSDLFGDKRSLITYGLMFGPKAERACPSCTSIVDSLDGASDHVRQRAELVVVARSPIERIVAHAHDRGWTHVRLLSSASNSFNPDYFAEDAEGSQWPMINVFSKDADGTVRWRWASELMFVAPEPGQDPRHADMIWPLWNLLDLTPEGRGEGRAIPKLSYG
jgi:predicted dithiol-disulfide oxidoreductase (DUF899 family)